ncbi:hypothetical protein [Deinococcus sp. Leaf326]|jgi:hypothetical protein|uniref:hypothetical protein n=1 Tax=Deinococcus sp. Leaf326 TaxID=1736338 RepID=UPI0006F65E91|nr:hypothetical protein [Deinococcus sp. Leaf326]KQQ99342.1 hypothetical protein ASF71_13200 [Deinococcus sp. Leaf326]
MTQVTGSLGVACESRGADVWRLEAQLHVADGTALRRELERRGLWACGRPGDLSTLLDAHLLFGDDPVSHETALSVADLGELAAALALSRRHDDLGAQLLAWYALARSLEASGRPARLLVWCAG